MMLVVGEPVRGLAGDGGPTLAPVGCVLAAGWNVDTRMITCFHIATMNDNTCLSSMLFRPF
jgi:hypothetical protein